MALISNTTYAILNVTAPATSASYDIDVTDLYGNVFPKIYLDVDATNGDITVNLPNISVFERFFNFELVVTRNDTSANTVTVVPFSSLVPAVQQYIGSETSVEIETRFESVIVSPVNDNGWAANTGGGGISAPVNITYAALYSKVVNNELTAGQWYRLLDYKSTNFLNGYTCASLNSNLNGNAPINVNFVPREIYTGTEEVLLLQAISDGKLSPIGYSETFNGDIVEYEPLTNKIGVQFSIQNGGILPNGNTISNFDLQWDTVNNEAYFDMPTGYPALYGQVMSIFAFFQELSGFKYNQDGFYLTTQNVTSPELNFTSDNNVLNNPKTTSPILIKNNGARVVMTDLTQNDVNSYQSGTLLVTHVEAIGDAFGYMLKRTDTVNNVTTPFDFKGRKFRRFEVNLSPANPAIGKGFNGIGDDFANLGTTGSFQDFKCFENAVNVYWTGLGFGFDSIGENDNNVFFGFISDVTIKNGFAENSLGSDIPNPQNAIWESTSVGDYFRFNVILRDFKNNHIGSGCAQNLWGENANNNTSPRNFIGNNIGNSFQRNFFNVDTQFLNYLSATHVYQSYSCTIDRTPNGSRSLTYVDDTHTLTVVPANS
jgi:hypothetical protein